MAYSFNNCISRSLRRGRRHRRPTRHLYDELNDNLATIEYSWEIGNDDTATGTSTSTSKLPLKRKRENSPTSEQVQQSSGEPIVATSCPICLEACENIGDHRISSLACGHLFGEKCLQRWLRADRSCCPTCQMECQAEDIRTIYASHVIALDRTTERRLHDKIRTLRQRVSELQQQLENE